MEPVAAHHIDQVIVTPDTSNDTIAVKVLSASSPGGAVNATVSTSPQAANGRASAAAGTRVARGSGNANAAFTIKLPHARLWSPSHPFLYNLTVTLSGRGSTDTVGSYFGMRTFGLRTVHGVSRVTLNGHPIYLDGVLDQGYWPDGLYTAPTDPALKSDIVQAKTLGFNAIRKHMKVEPARWYYWADKLGMIVLQDMPLPTAPTLTTAEVRNYQSQSRQIVSQLQDTTSIGVWILDNEHFTDLSAADDRALTKSVRALDPTPADRRPLGVLLPGCQTATQGRRSRGRGHPGSAYVLAEPEHGPVDHLQVRRPRNPRRSCATRRRMGRVPRAAERRRGLGNRSAGHIAVRHASPTGSWRSRSRWTPTPVVTSPGRFSPS